MLNSLLIFAEIILAFTGVILSFKFFKKEGVFAWVCVATVLANIITAKTARIFGMDVAIGTVLFSTVYLATDIISEVYGKQESKKAVKIEKQPPAASIASARMEGIEVTKLTTSSNNSTIKSKIDSIAFMKSLKIFISYHLQALNLQTI